MTNMTQDPKTARVWHCLQCGWQGADILCPQHGGGAMVPKAVHDDAEGATGRPNGDGRMQRTPETSGGVGADIRATLDERTRSNWATPPPVRKWLVADWLPDARIAMLTGAGGSGKSQLCLQLANALVSDKADDEGRRYWFNGGPEVLSTAAPCVFAS